MFTQLIPLAFIRLLVYRTLVQERFIDPIEALALLLNDVLEASPELSNLAGRCSTSIMIALNSRMYPGSGFR